LNQTLRITILSNTQGGVGSFTSALTRGLKERSCSLQVIVLSQTKKQSSKILDSQIPLFKGLAPNPSAFFNFLFRDDSDIVHANFASFFPFALWKKLVFKTPYVLTLHGLPQPFLVKAWKSKIGYMIEYMLVPAAVRYASSAVVVSNYTRNHLRETYGLDAKVISHGIEIKNMQISDKKTAKRSLGYSEDAFLVLYVGYLNRYKDPLLLIDAFSKVANEKIDLLLVGAGELYDEVQQDIKSKGLGGKVKLFGRVSDEKLALCYSAADLFVLPTKNEAFGIVLLEAMARNLPVVCSNSGACPEVIKEAGVLFEPGDPDDLAQKILTIKNSKTLSEDLSNKGSKRVREHFLLENEVDQYYNLLKTNSGKRLKQ
jgi:glycosyltransferase involved in cell wall biosynthesis